MQVEYQLAVTVDVPDSVISAVGLSKDQVRDVMGRAFSLRVGTGYTPDFGFNTVMTPALFSDVAARSQRVKFTRELQPVNLSRQVLVRPPITDLEIADAYVLVRELRRVASEGASIFDPQRSAELLELPHGEGWEIRLYVFSDDDVAFEVDEMLEELVQRQDMPFWDSWVMRLRGGPYREEDVLRNAHEDPPLYWSVNLQRSFSVPSAEAGVA